jgi:hypothetical protein
MNRDFQRHWLAGANRTGLRNDSLIGHLWIGHLWIPHLSIRYFWIRCLRIRWAFLPEMSNAGAFEKTFAIRHYCQYLDGQPNHRAWSRSDPACRNFCQSYCRSFFRSYD